jgi:hypothetical protein
MTTENAEGPPPQRPRRDWQSTIDEAIQDGIARGAFDNLPGQGQPLRWEDGPADSEWWLVHHVLKNAGFSPAWIEDRKTLAAERQTLLADLRAFAGWYAEAITGLAALDPRDAALRRTELAESRERRLARFGEDARRLNERIDRFNLSVPIAEMQLPKIAIAAEADGASAQMDGASPAA